MKKMIFAAACVALVSGCSDLPQKDGAVHEETYVMTGSHIARKAGTPAYGDAKGDECVQAHERLLMFEAFLARLASARVV